MLTHEPRLVEHIDGLLRSFLRRASLPSITLRDYYAILLSNGVQGLGTDDDTLSVSKES